MDFALKWWISEGNAVLNPRRGNRARWLREKWWSYAKHNGILLTETMISNIGGWVKLVTSKGKQLLERLGSADDVSFYIKKMKILQYRKWRFSNDFFTGKLKILPSKNDDFCRSPPRPQLEEVAWVESFSAEESSFWPKNVHVHRQSNSYLNVISREASWEIACGRSADPFHLARPQTWASSLSGAEVAGGAGLSPRTVLVDRVAVVSKKWWIVY